MVISLKDQEYFWGGLVQDGIMMPYGRNGVGAFERNMQTSNSQNQGAPFLVSNMGRFLWSEKPFTFRLEEKKLWISDERAEIIVDESCHTLKEAYLKASQRYFPPQKMGRENGGKASDEQCIPDPLLFLSPQYNTWIEMMYEPTEEKVLQYAQDILDHGMPAGVLTIDDNWQEDYGVWEFHQGRFQNPKAMVEKLHKMGFKVMLWVCNFVSPDSLTCREMDQKGLLVKDSGTGNMALAHWWNGYSGMLDLTNPQARAWFDERLHHLQKDYGIDGFKFDSGDPEHFQDTFQGIEEIDRMEYARQWASFGTKYALNEYRASWKAGGWPLAQRLCDKDHSWSRENGLQSLIPNGLAQGIMGYYYSCPDMIGGGEYTKFLAANGNYDEELVVRSAQCSALFPMMQFSVAPWRILDQEKLQICVDMANLHAQMGEKILDLAKKASQTGEPIIRYLEYQYPHSGYEGITDEFLLGEDILVAPVLEKGAGNRTVVFPEGKWKQGDTVITGPCEKVIDAPLDVLPWFEKM